MEITDGNDDSTINEGDTAYITGDSPPLRPQLVAQVKNPEQGSMVQWKLQVEYNKEVTNIPASGDYTATAPASQPWNIYQQYVDASNKDLGFFGGNATLTYKIDAQPADTIQFVIGGKNPNDAVCRAFIDSLAPGSAIAYPVAKHESFNQCGLGSIYNQFYDENSDSSKTVGFPVRSFDNGYGIYQITRYPRPTRDQKWSWQANVREGVRRLVTTNPDDPKMTTALDAANQLLKNLRRTYPDAEALPSVTYKYKKVPHTVSALDATTLTFYNGQGGLPTITAIVNKKGKTADIQTCWTYDDSKPVGQRWTFQPNQNDYVREVLKQIE